MTVSVVSSEHGETRDRWSSPSFVIPALPCRLKLSKAVIGDMAWIQDTVSDIKPGPVQLGGEGRPSLIGRAQVPRHTNFRHRCQPRRVVRHGRLCPLRVTGGRAASVKGLAAAPGPQITWRSGGDQRVLVKYWGVQAQAGFDSVPAAV